MAINKKYHPLIKAINQGNQELGVKEARKLVDSGVDVVTIFDDAIVPNLSELGNRFQRLEIFLPEMMYAADVVKAIHRELEDLIKDTSVEKSSGKIVIGTAYGDIHDLGKNIVISMLEVNGFEIHDLGVGVEAVDFIRKANEVDADIIAVSSLLTTSIPYMSDVIELRDSNFQNSKDYKILIGGGPINPDLAEELGADGYGDNAAEAVMQARNLIEA